MSHGEINISLKDPLSSETIFVRDIEQYIKDENNILIYLDNEPIPYIMKRSYFINLLIEDYDYNCEKKDDTTKYYNLSKLFLNHTDQPKIIINITQIESFSNVEYSYFKLTKSEPLINIRTNTNIDIKKQNYEEGEDYKEFKWDALAVYCDYGYLEINKYLVRLTEIPKFGLYEYFTNLILGKKKIEPTEQNIRIQTMVDDIDHLFYTYSEKDTENLILYRDMITFYTYLKNPGDKMVIENYMSCFNKKDKFGGLANNKYLDIHCIITVEPGIPFIRVYKNQEFKKYLSHPDEREVILPRNLVATYKGDDKNGNKLIDISQLYPNQFSKDIGCNEMTLYKIEKSKHGIFDWTVAGGTNKKSYKFSIRKRSNRKKNHSYKI